MATNHSALYRCVYALLAVAIFGLFVIGAWLLGLIVASLAVVVAGLSGHSPER